ncbi:hypothetical protein PRIPAC_97937 [Pristionchus pacificus]|uniref:Uncharacterized protein n=1 Tax=Pristionchus pacificus TaxID=54126 RepID=A0A2A6BIZ4_PRIPA|nr:hypothetical protein PRIPAC_97937 [Pristionchus pacificus]|eukprot:PDM65798.1 hypothetical protein PRIPAC_45199 [Pristionchus pacificus]
MSATHLEQMLRSLSRSDVTEVPCLTLHEWSLRHFRQDTPPLAPEHRRLYAVRSCPLVTSEGRASEVVVKFSEMSQRRRRSSSVEADATTLTVDDPHSGRRSPIHGALKACASRVEERRAAGKKQK